MICMDDVEQTEMDCLWYPYILFGKLTIVQGNPGADLQCSATPFNRK